LTPVSCRMLDDVTLLSRGVRHGLGVALLSAPALPVFWASVLAGTPRQAWQESRPETSAVASWRNASVDEIWDSVHGSACRPSHFGDGGARMSSRQCDPRDGPYRPSRQRCRVDMGGASGPTLPLGEAFPVACPPGHGLPAGRTLELCAYPAAAVPVGSALRCDLWGCVGWGDRKSTRLN